MNKKIKYQDSKIEDVFNSFLFPKNSIFFIHSDITNYDLDSNNWYGKCSNLYNLFDRYFKEHTILVPTFTYSFCKNKIFDIDKSPSEVGIFTEYFRNQKKVVRSNHPIFSAATKGPLSSSIIENLSNSSTGNGSIFERLRVFDAYIIFFGTEFMESCTFLHYIEQCKRVYYRYSKYFTGEVKSKKKSYFGEWEFYVRSTNLYKFQELIDNKLIIRDLIKSNLLKEKKISKLKISYCSAREIFDFIYSKLVKNENYIIGSKPIKL